MLPQEEASRRISAARTLRGLTQEGLDQLGAKEGLGKQELSRTERGELPLTKVRRDALTKLLKLPESWFDAETTDELLFGGESDADERLDRIERQLEAFAALDQKLDQLVGWTESSETRALLQRLTELFEGAGEDDDELGGGETRRPG